MRTAEAYKFMAAFYDLLALDPNTPPTPSELNVLLNLSGGRNINGRMSALRTELLQVEGFVKGPNGRWTNDAKVVEQLFKDRVSAMIAAFQPPSSPQVIFTDLGSNASPEDVETQREIAEDTAEIVEDVDSLRVLMSKVIKPKRFRLSLRRH